MTEARSAVPSRTVDRILDVGVVILISLATVASAWCGYQAARWSALQALSYSRANAARIESSIAAARSNSLRILDVGLFLQYELARFDRRTDFAAFLRRRFRPEFRTALQAWLATHPQSDPNAPLSPFAMREYHLKSDDDAQAWSRRGDRAVEEAVEANAHSDHYVFATVIFAMASFLGGVSIKARYPVSLVLVGVGVLLLLVQLIIVVEYPIR